MPNLFHQVGDRDFLFEASGDTTSSLCLAQSGQRRLGIGDPSPLLGLAIWQLRKRCVKLLECLTLRGAGMPQGDGFQRGGILEVNRAARPEDSSGVGCNSAINAEPHCVRG